MSKKCDDPANEYDSDKLINYALDRGCRERRSGGSHVVLTAPNGQTGTCPAGVRRLPRGTQHSVIRMFTRMGLLPKLITLIVAASLALAVYLTVA